jgi:hypothetical protein
VPTFQIIAAIRQGKDHREACAAADLENELHGQQRYDAEGDRAGRKQNSEKIEKARPHDRYMRRQRSRIDHGRDGIGGIVKSVDELEAERNEQGDEQQDIGDKRRNARVRGANIGVDAVGDEQQGRGNDAHDEYALQRVKAAVEVRPSAPCRLNRSW